MPIRAILDCDPGTDDAFALMLNLTSSISLIPFILVAGYGLKLARSGDSYDVRPNERRRDLAEAREGLARDGEQAGGVGMVARDVGHGAVPTSNSYSSSAILRPVRASASDGSSPETCRSPCCRATTAQRACAITSQ